MKIIAALFMSVLIISILAACSKSSPKSENLPNSKSTVVTHVSASQALAALKADPDMVVVDVRTPAEFASGHLEGAINVDFKNPNFATEIAKLDTRKSYLIHCRSGGRSRGALKVMQSTGFEHVTHMDGGMLAWKKANLPLKGCAEC